MSHVVGFGCGLAGRAGLVAAVAPALSSLNYTVCDAAGGDTISITGTNLSGATSVTVGGTSAAIGTNSPTLIVFTTPAKAAGTYNVQVTTAGGSSNTLSVQYYSLAALSLGEWHRASYSGSPWAGKASAGSSSTYSMTEATNPPAVGTGGNALNSYGTANCNGTSSVLASTAMSNIMTTTAWSLVVLLNPAAVSNTLPGEGEVISDTIGTFCLGTGNFSGTNKFSLEQYDTSWKHVEVPLTTGAWQLVEGTYDGTNINLRTNSNTFSSTPCGTNATLSGTLRAGASRAAFGFFYSGLIAEVMIAPSAFSLATNGTMDLIKACLNCRYGLSL